MKRILIAAGAVALALLTTTAAAQAEPLPPFDFSDCPTIPANADPGTWRCEVLASHGNVQIGRTGELPISSMRTVFAEGTIGGQYAQVFGSLQAEPIRVPGTSTTMRMTYAGFSDFLSVGDRMGELHLKIAARSPFLPRSCTIGTDQDPIVFKPLRTSGPEVVSQNPPVRKFSMRDNEFPVPRAYHCDPFERLLEHRLGVPSPAGTNDLTLTTYAGIKAYPTP
jgi:hypothetical protein